MESIFMVRKKKQITTSRPLKTDRTRCGRYLVPLKKKAKSNDNNHHKNKRKRVKSVSIPSGNFIYFNSTFDGNRLIHDKFIPFESFMYLFLTIQAIHAMVHVGSNRNVNTVKYPYAFSTISPQNHNTLCAIKMYEHRTTNVTIFPIFLFDLYSFFFLVV